MTATRVVAEAAARVEGSLPASCPVPAPPGYRVPAPLNATSGSRGGGTGCDTGPRR